MTRRQITNNKIIIETSARHIHLRQADLETLFGEGYELTKKKDLSQPGQFACVEKVKVVGPRGEKAMSVLGPVRDYTQIELALTDARSLGLEAPVRGSGDLAGSGACKLVGPKGEVELTEGVIAAKRHIHFSPEDAKAMGIKDRQIVKVEVETNGRSLVFGDVMCRVKDTYATFMHIDTDESNAAGGPKEGTIIVD